MFCHCLVAKIFELISVCCHCMSNSSVFCHSPVTLNIFVSVQCSVTQHQCFVIVWWLHVCASSVFCHCPLIHMFFWLQFSVFSLSSKSKSSVTHMFLSPSEWILSSISHGFFCVSSLFRHCPVNQHHMFLCQSVTQIFCVHSVFCHCPVTNHQIFCACPVFCHGLVTIKFIICNCPMT